MARLFIAVDLPERIRDDISATYIAMYGVRWVDENQLHLTLRFIGDVDTPTEDRIISALRDVTFTTFSLSLKGVGVFPPRKEPRVLWVGLSDRQELISLQSQIERKLVSIGIPQDQRKFHPHITVARLNNADHTHLASYLSNNSLLHSELFTVSAFHLYRSYLKKEGAEHLRSASFSVNPIL